MPEIASFTPAPSIAPAAAAVAVATPAGVAAVDSTPANFLGQLKTALKNLTKVVTQPDQSGGTQKTVALGAAPTDAATPLEPDKHADAEQSTSANLPELLAALGFGLVPTVPPVPSVPTSGMTPKLTGKPAVTPAAAAAVPTTEPLFQSDSVKTPALPATTTASASTAGPALPVPTTPAPAPGAATPGAASALDLARLPQPQNALVGSTMPAASPKDAAQPQTATATTLAGTPAPQAQPGTAQPQARPASEQLQAKPASDQPQAEAASDQPQTKAAASDQPQLDPVQQSAAAPVSTANVAQAEAIKASVDSGPAKVVTQPIAADPSAAAPLMPAPLAAQVARPGQAPLAPASVAASAVPIFGPQSSTSKSGFQQGPSDDSESRHQSASKTATISASTPVQDAPAPDAGLAAVAATAPPGTAAPLAAHVQAAAVVSQIANQADLYRLPGQKALRIQLHPDDLGGVQVTVRYSAVGGVELHINVEHATTGTLVQAGWTELRDALGTQGISADRLVMSVTSAGNAGADLSGGGGSRSDPGQASFNLGTNNQSNQSGHGQSGQSGQQQAGARGWAGGSAASASDDSQDVASSAVAPSRIDYRV